MRHPLGHLGRAPGLHLDLELRLPLGAGGKRHETSIEHATEELMEELDAELDSLLTHRAVFQPGKVLSLRHDGPEPEHYGPEDPRQVFVGYGPSGVPQFRDFGQWMIERRDPRVELLYREPPRLLTVVVSGRELAARLLPAFRDAKSDYRVHGQVAAGWFRVPGHGGRENLALTFQVVSSRRGSSASRSRRRRLGLNVLGMAPGGEPLETLYDRMHRLPWASAVDWAQEVLESIGRSVGRKSTTPEQLSKRIEGLLGGLARRLERPERSKKRRTRHAQKRHGEGERPTGSAQADLARASRENVFYDVRRETLVVLGERGRAHVFNPKGKLVTSIRTNPDAVARKQKKGTWRPASAEQVAELRRAAGGEPERPKEKS